MRKEDSLKVIALVAMKSDLGNQFIPINEINEFAKEYDLLVVEASALKGSNVVPLFEQIAIAYKQTLEEFGKVNENMSHIIGVNSMLPRKGKNFYIF